MLTLQECWPGFDWLAWGFGGPDLPQISKPNQEKHTPAWPVLARAGLGTNDQPWDRQTRPQAGTAGKEEDNK